MSGDIDPKRQWTAITGQAPMPDRPDLPAVATPWEDPMGEVWCATPDTLLNGRHCVRVHHWYPVARDNFATWGDWGIISTYMCHPALLAGLGRTLPEGPTPASTPPKRVAKVVRYDAWELAAKGDVLFESLDGKQWRHWKGWGYHRKFITAAAEAFAGAGDVLPGEAE